MSTESSHIAFLNQAIELAEIAESENEVPIGAVIVTNGKIIGKGWNQKEQTLDVSSHAEINALRDASRKIKN